MKRKYIIIGIITIVAATAWFFTSAKYPVEKNVHVLCNYMGYACGDCYPQYTVKLVMPESLGKKLANKEIDIEFDNAEKERAFEKKRSDCSICYQYDLFGDLHYSNRKKCYVLKVKQYKLKEKFEGCCSH
jgi:hypothetical protein